MAMTGDGKNIFLDTNVLIRATIELAPFHIDVYQAVNHLWARHYRLWISRQILPERRENAPSACGGDESRHEGEAKA